MIRTRGIRGELTAIAFSDDPGRVKQVFVNQTPLEIEQVWMHGDRLIFKFLGIDSINAAEPFMGAEVCIPGEERALLPEGEFFQSDLLGCEVVEQDSGRVVGVVTGWQEHGGPALLELKSKDGKEILIPFAKSICVEIDPGARRIQVVLPEGLEDL